MNDSAQGADFYALPKNLKIPFDPIGWQVLVLPRQPKKVSAGGIILTDDTQAADEVKTCCGQIVALGNLCFQAKTKAGLDLTQLNPMPKVGDWIVYSYYAGIPFPVKDGDEILNYKLITDTEVRGVTYDPQALVSYIR